MSLFPRFVSHDFPRITSSDFAPVWRLIDDYANQVVSARNSEQSPAYQRQQSFNPRFDVKENDGVYELKGELPGVDQKNIEIEFPDQQTIVIKGSTGYNRESTPAPVAESAAAETEATPSEHSHQATVEDEPELIDASDATSTVDGTEAAAVETPAATPQPQAAHPASTESGRYWVTERYTGSFQRTFTFPGRVDTEGTTARLNNGVLEVIIPKVQPAGIKRVSIQ